MPQRGRASVLPYSNREAVPRPENERNLPLPLPVKLYQQDQPFLLRAPLSLTGGRKVHAKKGNKTTSTQQSTSCHHLPCRLLRHRQQLVLLPPTVTVLYQGKKAQYERGLWVKVLNGAKYSERKNSMILLGLCIQWREGAIRES